VSNKSLEEKLNRVANDGRKLIIEMACRSKSAHVGSALSCVDLLTTLYFNELRIDLKKWDERDIFVLSKAHGAMALYAMLALKGIIDIKMLNGYLQNDGTLPAHMDAFSAKGIEVSAGSLGHGFNIALGMAHGYKLKKDKRRVFALLGDGETEEGSVWEGALFASKLEIDNFTAIVDYNNLQGYGRPREICHFEPVIDKWKAFGWEAFRVNGHDFKEISSALKKPHKDKPKVIIADTTKGKGVSFMENEMKWHYFIVTDEFRKKALKELCNKYA
jgi:transketolase